jgi:hypothetical protein
MRVAGSKMAIRRREVRSLFDRQQELRYCLFEAPTEEVCSADYGTNCADAPTGA